MEKLVGLAGSLSEILDRVVGWICILLGSLMTVIVFVAVIFRYVLNSPLEWSEEISTFMMVWFAMLGASMGVRRGRHVGVSYIIENIEVLNRNSRWIGVASNFLILIFMFVLLQQGYFLALFARQQISPALMISMFWPYFGLLVGSVAVCLQLICQIIKALAGSEVYVLDACCYIDE